MQPYINPYLFLNPTCGNYGQQQPMMQPTQPVGIAGKYVNDFSEIVASDIPMNSPAIFAKNDKSEIQIREWNANGQITTTTYKAIVEAPTLASQPKFDVSELLEPILGRLSELEEKIDKLPKPTMARAKKEGE